MTSLLFLTEWALRSSILILVGALLLRVLCVKDPGIRLTAWTALLFGSLAIPAMTAALPPVSLPVVRSTAPAPVVRTEIAPESFVPQSPVHREMRVAEEVSAFDWARISLIFYMVVASALLLRLGIGLALSLRLLRHSTSTSRNVEGTEIRESDRISAPVTLGILRPVIVLPPDWSEWSTAKLEAVLAHERSHIRRFDPAVQLASAIHRALLWHSPLSWFLHSRIVRVAEEASDDAALMATQDRTGYAEILLDFMQRGVRGPEVGVPMARYGRADARINRILDTALQPGGMTRGSIIAILVVGLPLAYVVATVHAQSAKPAPSVATPAPVAQIVTRPTTARTAASPKPEISTTIPNNFVVGLGTVVANTVTVRPLIDGLLTSVTFKEGEMVQAGQLLATMDQPSYQIELDRVKARIVSDETRLDAAPQHHVPDAEKELQADHHTLNDVQFQLSLGQIKAPITGMVGLLHVSPGNIIHAQDGEGIVTIAQLQPIAVVFTLPQDVLPQVRNRAGSGENPVVEAWTRDNKVRIAAGRLIAVDNQIDPETGTVKLKATFDNKDGALFPNQFVNVRLMLNNR